MKETNNKKRSWKRLVTILSCVVVFCTTYALILPAVAQSKTYYCGKEEHTHSEDCYHSSEPLCGKEVSEAIEGHTHSEECYELVENKSLICGQEESELHVHDDSCFQVEQVQNLICGKEEAEASEGHTHSDDCYRSDGVLCGKEEHTHSRECESNKEDVEDPNNWNEAYKEIAKEEDAKKRILTVAKNELNYKENEANFEIDEEGKEHYYTRYGHFYEDKYGDWNNYFTGFVLNYANVQMNFDKDISKWQVKTVNDQNQEVGKEGNVVFFRDDEGELRSGILVEFNELKNDVKIIYGDVDNRVQEVNVNKDKVIAYLDDEVKIEEEDTPLAGGEENKEEDNNKEESSESEEVETLTKTATDAKGTVEVTATYQSTAKIPEEAEFRVKRLDPDEDGNARYDIGFYVGNDEKEPETPVSISIKFLNSPYMDNTTITYFHEKQDGSVEEIDSSVHETEEGLIESRFTATSFSLYTVRKNTTVYVPVGGTVSGVFKNTNDSNSYGYVGIYKNLDYFTSTNELLQNNNSFEFDDDIIKLVAQNINGKFIFNVTGKKEGTEQIALFEGSNWTIIDVVVIGEDKLVVNYDIAKTHGNYTEGSHQYYPEPSIQNSNLYTDVLTNDTSSYEVMSPDVFEYGFGHDGEGNGNVGSEDYRRFMFQFDGWIVNNNDQKVIPAGTVLTKEQLSEYTQNGVINLTAKWNSKGKEGTVNFYVNRALNTYEDYKFNSTTNIGSDKFLPTSIYAASVSILSEDTNYQAGKVYAAYNSEALDWRTSPEKVNNKIRGLTEKTQLSENKTNEVGKFQLSSFPSDEVAMAEIRKQQADPNVQDGKKVKDENGKTVDADTITPSNYTIHWYVFKMQNKCWHIDGCLVRKEASLTVKKTFAGNAEAVEAAKKDFNIKVNLKTIGSENEVEKTLHLTGEENKDLNATQSQSTGPRDYDESTNTYTWVVPLKTNREYEINENNYIVDQELSEIVENERMATVAQYAITNSNNPTNGRNIYANNEKITITAESYTKNTDYNDFQTVNFFNTYIPANQLLISKYGDYGLPLSNVEFQLFRQDSQEPMKIYLNEEGIYNIYGGSGEETLTNSFKTDKNGFVYIKGLKDEGMVGTYILREVNSLEGYNKIDDIYLNVDNSGNITLSSLQNQDFVQMEQNVLEIKNTSQTTSLKVTKEWAEGSVKEKVRVMLTRNGVSIQGTERLLGEDNNWTTTWTDIPLYVGGKRANYSVKETWIGDTSYDEKADNDGYANYNVTISQTIQGNEGYQVIVRNSVATYGFSFTKTGELGGFKVLEGAKFRLSRNPDIPEDESHRDRVSDSNGIVDFGVLPAGIYYMKEIEAPKGYECSDQIYKVEISGNKTIITKLDDVNATPLESIPNYLANASLTINKVDNNGEALKDAEFTLIKKNDPNFKMVQTSDFSGIIEFKGLKTGSYILKETKAPAGYNLLTTSYEFDVNEGQITFTDQVPKEYKDGVLKVVNNAGQALPNTGGTGTKLFTFSGGAIIAASSLMYGYKKRQKGKKKGGIQ